MPVPNVERCHAFWTRQEVDRPLLATWVGSFEITKLFPRGLGRLPDGELTPDQLDFEYFREDYEALYENHRQATVDVPWSAAPVMLMPWVEAIAGCRIVHNAGNIWAEPFLDSYDQIDGKLGLRPRRDWLETLVKFTEWLVKLSEGRFPIGTCLMRGPADVLAAMRGAQNSVLDLMDRPAAVRSVLEWITGVWVEAARAQLSRIQPLAGGYGWSVQNLWSEEPGGWFQDDAIAYWSPSLYREYAAPCEITLSKTMARTGYHLHSASIFAVDELLRMPDLNVVQVNLDDAGLTIPEMIPDFQRILKTKPLYVWGDFTEDDLVTMKENLPTRGLALQLMSGTPESVRAMVARVEEIWLG